jgi:hypothetical protein
VPIVDLTRTLFAAFESALTKVEVAGSPSSSNDEEDNIQKYVLDLIICTKKLSKRAAERHVEANNPDSNNNKNDEDDDDNYDAATEPPPKKNKTKRALPVVV